MSERQVKKDRQILVWTDNRKTKRQQDEKTTKAKESSVHLREKRLKQKGGRLYWEENKRDKMQTKCKQSARGNNTEYLM